jgi:ribose 5-phosphate isomerase B
LGSSGTIESVIIALGSDHAGFLYKEAIKRKLEADGHEVLDFGTFSLESCDYPTFVRPAAEAVASGKAERGIVLGGSGNGEAMVSNRVKGIRCGVCWNEESVRLTRAHNDANMIALGERMMSEDMALRIVDLFLSEPFEGGRHVRRIKAIDELPRVSR